MDEEEELSEEVEDTISDDLFTEIYEYCQYYKLPIFNHPYTYQRFLNIEF